MTILTMKNKWNKAIVTRKIDLTDSITTLFLKSNIKESINFTPGQFITLDLPIADDFIKRWRSYTIASAPHDMNEEYDFELCISKFKSGDGSLYLYNNVSVGDELKYKGPAGNFTLNFDEDSIVIMIGTETGIAPFRSMLRTLQHNGTFPHKIELIHHVDHEDELLYRDEMLSLMDILPYFRYSAHVQSNKYWLGCNKDISQEIIQNYIDASHHLSFYISGWPEMVKNTIDILINKLGYTQKQVAYQIYR